MSKNILNTLIVILFFKTIPAGALTLTEENTSVSISRNVRVVFAEKETSIHEVIKIPDSDFSESSGRSLGYHNDVVWAKIDIENIAETEKWFLVQYVTHTGKISLYIVDEEFNSTHIGTTGRDIDPGNRKISFKYPTIPFDLKHGFRGWLYIRVESENNLLLSMSINSHSSVVKLSNIDGMYHGFFYGIFLALLILSLLLFFKLGDALYLRYSLYIASMTLLQITVTHDGSEFLWPGAIRLDKFTEVFSFGLMTMSLSFFLKSYISEIFDKIPRLLLNLNITSGFLVCLAPLLFPDHYSLTLRFALFVSLLVFPFVSIALLIAWIRQVKCASLLFFGSVAMTLGIYYQVLHKIGYLSSTLSFNLFQVSCIADAFFFIAAISEKTKHIRINLDAYEKINVGFRSIAHEMKKPLSVLISLKNVMKEYADKNDPASNYVIEYAEASLNSTKDIVNDALNLGSAKLNISRISVEKTIREIIEYPEYVKFLLEGPDFYIVADKVKFKRVLINILDNAVRYHKDQTKRPVINLMHKKDMKVMSVTNFGTALAEEKRKVVFNLGYTSDGIGLGLYLSKIITELHGWWIGCSSDMKEKSVTFTIKFIP